jgi:hypothetical protein
MFCPECGIENKDNATFCFDCGARIKPIGQTPKKVFISKPDPGMIIFGIIIILVIYFIPVFQTGMFGGSLTLAVAFNQCSSPMPIIRCSDLIPWLFFGAWVFAVILIVMGIFNKKVQ